MLDIKLSPQEASLDNEPAEVPLHDRDGNLYDDGNGNVSTFLVLGEYSDVMRAYDRAEIAKTLKRRSRANAQTVDRLEDGVVNRLAAAVVGWRHITSNGVPVPFSTEGVRDILRSMPWTQNDVAQGMVQHSGFFAKASAP